jgi:hypothetical protein
VVRTDPSQPANRNKPPKQVPPSRPDSSHLSRLPKCRLSHEDAACCTRSRRALAGTPMPATLTPANSTSSCSLSA